MLLQCSNLIVPGCGAGLTRLKSPSASPMEALTGNCTVGAAEDIQGLGAALGNLQTPQKRAIQKTNFFRQRSPYSRRADVMKRMCRIIGTTTWCRRQLAMSELLHNARVVTDPNTLARLKAEAARRN